ncbi:MAG TPA: LysE family transporter [Cyclobacteriaceae bacterium]|nr:LysE family transporter [Cyclobacteriaceae bacterium]
MDIIAKGILSGIILSFLIGPVFFTILQTSIERGFNSGALVAIGVSLSDASYISLTYLGLSHLMDNPNFKTYLAYAGGLILVGFGVYYLFIKSRKLLYFEYDQVQKKKPFRYIAKGFIINGLSPMVFLFWIGTVSFATTELGYTKATQAALYFSSIVMTVFSTDILKAKLADKLRLIITPRFIRTLNIVLGIVLVIFGGRLIFFADQFTMP